MTGINKEYAKGESQPGIDNPWFGMELNYDRGFDKKQFNGNIAGTMAGISSRTVGKPENN